jgi:hypothetical protein
MQLVRRVTQSQSVLVHPLAPLSLISFSSLASKCEEGLQQPCLPFLVHEAHNCLPFLSLNLHLNAEEGGIEVVAVVSSHEVGQFQMRR